MADYIYRQAAIYAVHKSIFDFFDICDDDEESPMTYKEERLLMLNKAITTQIEAAPSIDAVEVVRCKNCRHADRYYHCIFSAVWNDKNHYCSYGERKDG